MTEMASPAAEALFGAELPQALVFAESLAERDGQRALTGPRETTLLWVRHRVEPVVTTAIGRAARMVEHAAEAGA